MRRHQCRFEWEPILTALNALPLTLAKYEILGEIGHGGMATVYRARDRRLGRDVALKVIHRHLRQNEEVGRRFAGEALAVAKVKHPNIVEVYDVSGEDEQEQYLVTELIEGLTLRQLLSKYAPLPPEVAACIAVEITRALAQAHRHGVVHRDVKPENVLLRMGPEDSGQVPDSGHLNVSRVKLTDFGIAKLLDAQGVTSTGQVLGSPAHMAPEQIEGGDVDARSDVFGVGVLLYEMLTGVLPFEGKNPAQVLRRVLEGSFVPADRARPEVGSCYGSIVGCALAHSPADRYASAGAMGDALESELKLFGVDDVRVEIVKFLDAPERHIEEHRRTIPDKISARASEARKAGNVMLSASYFNRALAYRPDDTVLLAEVAGLARRTRRQRRVRRVLLGCVALSAGAAATALVVVVGSRWRSAPTSAQKGRPEVTAAPSPSVAAVGLKVLTSSEPQVARLPTDLPQVPKRHTALRPARPVDAGPTPDPGTRSVRTPVVGPQNAKVRIDGVLQPWFAVHELRVGPHTFEFVAPNEECCEATSPQTIEIVAGEGPQLVRGTIAFRPSVLQLEAPPGARASCGIAGVIEAGQSRSIPMSQPERHLTCTIFPVPGVNGEPKRIDVDLRPGRTFTLTGP